MPTSPSAYTCGSTSSLMPTSTYGIEPVNTVAWPACCGEIRFVMTGSLSPTRMRAFSLLRVRMRGLARMFASAVLQHQVEAWPTAA